MTDWLTRYRNGQRDQVWHELGLLGGESGRIDEARAVCDEMAHRARQNVEAIVERLTEDGFRFHDNNDAQTPATPHTPPTDDAAAHIAWLEQRIGSVPLTLSSWVRIVGDVWLVGTHPEWPTSAGADPLVIEVEGSRYPCSSMRKFVEEEWNERDDSEPFVLVVAPDQLHKDNVSGGSPYGIVLPDGGADGLFWQEGVTTPFVSYLNWAFQNGGFPGPDDDGQRIRDRLALDLLPL